MGEVVYMHGQDARGADMTSLVENEELQRMIECEKLVDEARKDYVAPSPGNGLAVQLHSSQMPKEKFILSIFESKRTSEITLSISSARKTNIQTRASTTPLVRVDFGDRQRHTNPDGTIIIGGHVHVASWRHGMAYAYPITSPEAIMVAGSDPGIESVFEAFRKFCHIDGMLSMQWTLEI